MANPTSNFGWQMPTPTDLVTDLPADFEVFGQAVDSDFVDLLGGPNGYILAKASAADLDFAWIPNDQGDITAVNVTAPITGGGSSGAVTIGVSTASTAAAGVVQLSDSTSTTSSVLASTPTATKAAFDLADGAIAKSTLTTAGDLLYRNATVPVRLGIGTANQVLRVNSGATAPEWATPSMPAFVGCSLKKVAAQTTSAATYTNITFTAEDIDTNGFHDNSTNTTRITIPSGYGGKYLITAQLSGNDGDQMHTSAIKKNGTIWNTLPSNKSAASGGGASIQNLIMDLAVADYVEIAQYSGLGVQINGTAQNDRPSVFACQFLGA